MKKLYTAVLLLPLLAACDNWFDIDSTSDIKDLEMFSEPIGFYRTLTGQYIQMANSSLYGGLVNIAVMDVVAQTWTIKKNVDWKYLQTYEYGNGALASLFNGIWSKSYNVIANCNHLLQQLELHDRRAMFPEGNCQILEAETRALRAYVHFELLRMFAPAPSSVDDINAVTIKVPYVDKLSKTAFPNLTLGQALGRVLEDLTFAADTLAVYDPYFHPVDGGTWSLEEVANDDGFRSNRPTHLNYFAVEALLARVKLYMGDRQGALAHARRVLPEKLQPFDFEMTNTATAVNNPQFKEEIIFYLYKRSITEDQLTYFDLIGSTSFCCLGDNDMKLRFYEHQMDDSRLKNQWKVSSFQTTWTMSEFGVRDGESALTYNKYSAPDIIPMIRMSEVSLIAAECYASYAQKDSVLLAAELLNGIYAARGVPQLDLPYLAVGDNYLTLDIDARILTEYRKEFLGEGQLFFYFKRLNFETIEGANGTIRTMTPAKYVFPIPSSEFVGVGA